MHLATSWARMIFVVRSSIIKLESSPKERIPRMMKTPPATITTITNSKKKTNCLVTESCPNRLHPQKIRA